jgi:hypothetical protein
MAGSFCARTANSCSAVFLDALADDSRRSHHVRFSCESAHAVINRNVRFGPIADIQCRPLVFRQKVFYCYDKLLRGVWLCQKTKPFDEHSLHPVREPLAGCVKDWRIDFSFDCFLGQHQSGLEIRLKTDVGEDEVNPRSAFNKRDGLVEVTRGKCCMAVVLKYSLCEDSDLVVVLDDQYDRHTAPFRSGASRFAFLKGDISDPSALCLLTQSNAGR